LHDFFYIGIHSAHLVQVAQSRERRGEVERREEGAEAKIQGMIISAARAKKTATQYGKSIQNHSVRFSMLHDLS
jgi:hypothetical protein